MSVSRRVLVTLVAICLASGTLGGVVGAALMQRVLAGALQQQAAMVEARMRRVCDLAVDAGKLEACREAMSQTCAIQWGKKCVGKKPGTDPYE